jgi:sterol desaturase/sphingolipid hydroxylase (fatty acid hydroxylase superfamily)
MYGEAIIVFIVFASMTTVAIIIGLIAYFCKRLEHKQILAAIEKGTPLSELKPPKKEQQNGSLWIRSLTFGVAMMIIGLGWWLAGPGYGHEKTFIAFILIGVGVAWIIRGLLFRKYQGKSRLSANGNTAEYKNSMSAPIGEISQQSGE